MDEPQKIMESYWKYNQIETLVTAAPPDAGFVPKQIIKILYKYQHGKMYCFPYPIKQATIEIFGFQLRRQQSFNLSLFVCVCMSICVVYVSASVHICVFMYMCVCVCVYMGMWRSKVGIRNFPQKPFALLFETWILLSLSLWCWGYRRITAHLTFIWGLAI